MAPHPIPAHDVNYTPPRSFGTVLKSKLKETFLPDDPFSHLSNEPSTVKKAKKIVEYFVPICEWLPNYNLALFKYDLLSGITIASLAIPQGISYAKLANIPPIVGLYSSFVPPLIYSVFGSSKHLAVGTVAASSLIIAANISVVANPVTEPMLYLSLVYTACLISGLLQITLGFLRLGILIDFLSHSTITGFMGGTAIIICLQQLKGLLGITHFTTHTDTVNVLKSVLSRRNEWQWQSAVIGLIFIIFLQFTRFVKEKRPKLFWVSAIAPIATVIVGGLFAYFANGPKHGIMTVGPLKKGINPISIHDITFDSKYLGQTFKAGAITAMVALAEGIAIGRSFAIQKNEQIDGNKEMIAFGLMNIVGSLTSCYLTTGPFSKTAVNFNAGCRTQMSNVIMALCMLLTLLFLAPLFSHTPLVALSAIIMSAMFGLIDYKKAHHLFKTDKFDFLICIGAFLGVAFISMDIGLMISIGLALLRALLYVARPSTCKLGNLPGTRLFRDIEQYPDGTVTPGILAIKIGSPIYYANCQYIRERILRYVKEEQSFANDHSSKENNDIEYIILDLGDVVAIDITGVETFLEILKLLESKDVKMILVNPRLPVLEKFTVTRFFDSIGKDSVFLAIEDAIEACKFSLQTSKRREGVEMV